MSEPAVPRLGAFFEGDRIRFQTWAPERRRASVVLFDDHGRAGVIAMDPEPGGFFSATLPVTNGLRRYRISLDDDGPFPDPWSRSQPEGVHGPSEVVDASFAWSDHGWPGVALEDLCILELHVGAATPEGTFDALVPRLAGLAALGVTAIELMPVASFPGRWNWGYDGVSLFAPAAVYGGPHGLRRLVDAAHAAGLGVMLDVVYNHLGPDGSYLGAFSRRAFTDRHPTPWGAGLDLDLAPVRELLLANAEMWIRDYHADGLRLDATDTLADDRAPHVLEEIAARARAAGPGRRVLVIAEDDRNDARLLRPALQGGYGLDAVWAGDFHHAARRAITGDHEGYFADFSGTTEELARALDRGWIFEGQPSFRTGRPRGTPAAEVAPARIVQFLQNHDQVGNRAFGDRLGPSAGAAAFRALTALLLLSPYTPLLFMGEEWDASTPFQFFTDHHAELGEQVRAGRRREYAAFASFAGADLPDPQDEATFRRSKLDEAERAEPEHAGALLLHRELLALRRSHPALLSRTRGSFAARPIGASAVALERTGGGAHLLVIANLRGALEHTLDVAGDADWRVILATEEERFGSAAPISAESTLTGSALHLEGPIAVVLERTRTVEA
jgi:maltooligosyltrehalose trehalohydrolase